MSEHGPFTGNEDSLVTITAAWGSASDLKARRMAASDLAIFAAVRALADGTPLVAVMNALDFPMEPQRKPDPLSFSFLGSQTVRRELGFAEWFGAQITGIVRRMADERESA